MRTFILAGIASAAILAEPARSEVSEAISLSLDTQAIIAQHLSARVETRDFITSSLQGSSSGDMTHVCGLVLVKRGTMYAEDPVPFYVFFANAAPDIGAALVARPNTTQSIRETCAEKGDLLRADWTASKASQDKGWRSWVPGF